MIDQTLFPKTSDTNTRPQAVFRDITVCLQDDLSRSWHVTITPGICSTRRPHRPPQMPSDAVRNPIETQPLTLVRTLSLRPAFPYHRADTSNTCSPLSLNHFLPSFSSFFSFSFFQTETYFDLRGRRWLGNDDFLLTLCCRQTTNRTTLRLITSTVRFPLQFQFSNSLYFQTFEYSSPF